MTAIAPRQRAPRERPLYAAFVKWSHAGFVVAIVLSIGGCADDGEGDDGQADSGPSTGTDPTTSGGDTGTSTTDTPSTTSDPTMADSTDSGDDSPSGECILWEIDECGAAQKCMPWSLNPDRIPDEIRCCPAPEDPDVEGDPCTIQDYDGSCLDSCDVGTMCVLDDIDTLGGQCRRFCEPGGNDCTVDQTCKTFFELLPIVPNVPLCMDKCDPLVQDCPLASWLCIPDSPTEAGQSGFICVSPPPEDPSGLLDSCALANDCEKGLVCVPASRVPGCTANACCTSYCDLGEGDAPCTAIDNGLSCVDWMSPEPQWDHVGVCAIPD